MSMLTSEHQSIYTADDPILMILFVGLLFMTTFAYIIRNINHFRLGSIGGILLFMSIYMSIWRVIGIPPTASTLSYIYQPMCDMLIIVLFLIGYSISVKSKELCDYFTTAMMIAMLITVFFYYKNWKLANEINQAHLGTSYYALFLLPTILLSPHKWIKYLAITLTGIVIISSFKRGGLIALVLGLIAYLFVKEVLLEKKITKLLWFILLIIILFIALIFIDNAMGNIISTRLMNITKDGGSGRDQVWAVTWDMIRYSDLKELLLGHGYNAVLKDSRLGFSAHNDFLEVLYNYGIVCFIPYVLLHFQLVKQTFSSIRQKKLISTVMAFTYVFFFILSMISHVVVYPWVILIALSWGLMYKKQNCTDK